MSYPLQPFDDDGIGGPSIPMFNKNGTALSEEERLKLANRRGQCVRCGIKTHDVQILRRIALTSEHVYNGTCIRCNPNQVPHGVFSAWEGKQRRTAPATNKFKAAARVAATVHRAGHQHLTQTQPALELSPARGGDDGGNRAHGGNTQRDSGGLRDSGHSHLLNPPRNRDTGVARASTRHVDLASSRGLNYGASSAALVFDGNGSSNMAVKPPPLKSSATGNEDYTGGHSEEDAWEVVKAIRDNRRNVDVLKQKLHRLRNLSDDGHAGAPYELKEVMDEYSNDSRIMATACGALWAVTAQHDETRAEAADSGAIDLIVQNLRNSKNKRDPDFLQWAIGTLACLARGLHNKAFIAEAGGIEAILEALDLHQESAGVFEWSCRALHALVHQYDKEGDAEYTESAAKAIRKNIVLVQEANGVAVIMNAMKNHFSETIAQGWAMKLLLRLLDRGNTAATNRVLHQINQQEGIAACIKVLKTRSTTPEVFALTAELMANLVAEIEDEVAFLDSASECIPTIVRVMNEHSRNENVQQSCCRLLARLAGSNKLQIKDCHALGEIVNAMIKFPTNLPLQEAASWILWTISFIPAFFDYTYVKDALRTLNTVTKAFPGASVLHAGVCGFIANISLSSSIKMSEVPIEIPVRAIQMNAGEGMVYREAARALTNICTEVPSKVDRILEGDAVISMIEYLIDVDAPGAEDICTALAAMSLTKDENKQKLVDAGCLEAAVHVLRTSSSQAMTEKAFSLITGLVVYEKKRYLQLPSDVISVIMKTMESRSENTRMMETACGVIKNILLIIAPGSTPLIVDGLVESMIGFIGNPTIPVELKREACGVLWAFVAKQPKQAAPLLLSMYRSVLGVMDVYKGTKQPYNSDLQSVAAGALASITACIRDFPIHIAAEDIDLIIAVTYMVMEYDRDRTELLEKLLDTILNLSFINDGLVIKCGGIVMTIDAMTENEGNEAIQERACSILALLSSTENLQVNLCIQDTDGIDLIINALAVFPQNELIQVDVCKALSHLSVDPESRALIASFGGLLLVVNAMTSNRDNIDLLEGACSALLNLSSDTHAEMLEDSSVVETVIDIMNYHLDASQLQEKGLGVLQNISMRNIDAKRAIAEAGGIAVVTAAIKENMGSPTVLDRAFTTMWSLALYDGNQVAIANADGISLLVNGMMAAIDSEKVQKQAFGCLCALASNSRNKKLIQEAGASDAIVFAMWSHYGSEQLQIEACRTLSIIALNVQTNEVMLATHSEVNALISAMRRFPDSSKLQEYACLTIRYLLLSSDNAALIENNAVEIRSLMTRAADDFPANCAERANQVLSCL